MTSIVFFISSSVKVLSCALKISSYATLFLFSPSLSLLYISNSLALSRMFFAFLDMIFSICPTSISSSTTIAISLSTAGYFGIGVYFLFDFPYFANFSKSNTA